MSPCERTLDRLGAVGRLGDDLEVRLGVEDHLQPVAHERMVVGDEDPCDEGDRHRLSPPPPGTSSRTSTPPSGPGLIATAPPTINARSRMPRKPPPSGLPVGQAASVVGDPEHDAVVAVVE